MISDALTFPTVQELIDAQKIPLETPQRYILLSAADALKPQTPINWIVSNLFSAGSVSLIVGEGGSKKTWLALDAAVCVAQGSDWLHFQTQQTAVLIIDEESGNRRLSRRLSQVLRGHSAKENTPLYYASLSAFDFRNPDDINYLHTIIIEKNARLVIIDALADVMPGADENTVKDVQPLFLALRRVAETTGAAIVIIHHSNKAGSYRGSTAIKGAVDLMLQVVSKPESPTIYCKTEKVRDSEPFEFTASFAYADDQVFLSDAPNRSAIMIPDSQYFVLRYLSENGASKIGVIAGAAEVCSCETARKAVYDLAKKKIGYTTRINAEFGTGRGVKAIYDLTEKGRAYLAEFPS